MERKEKVKILGEHFGVKPKYLGAPSFSYEIVTADERYLIDKEGCIMTQAGIEVEIEALIAEPEEETITYELVIPMKGHSGKTLRNIINMIHSKQPLIKKSLGLEDELVNSDFVEKLNEENIISIDSFERALDRIGDTEGHPVIDFDFKDQTFTFNFIDSEAGLWLFAGINKLAKRQAKALSRVSPMENEKYTFRSWLNRLDMGGDEFREIRKELLKNLSGNSAYRVPNKKKVRTHEA